MILVNSGRAAMGRRGQNRGTAGREKSCVVKPGWWVMAKSYQCHQNVTHHVEATEVR